MRITSILILIAGMCTFSIQSMAQRDLTVKKQREISLNPEQEALLKQRFKQVKIVRIDLPALYQLSHTKKTNIPVTLSNGLQTWDMVIEENEIRSPDYKQEFTNEFGRFEVPRDACGTFKGYEKSDPESWVRMNIREHSFSAIMHSSKETYYAELLKNFTSDVDENWVVIYKASDLVPTEALCGGGSMLNQLEQNRRFIDRRINHNQGNEKNSPYVQDNEQPKTSIAANSTNNNLQAMLSTQATSCRKLEIVTDSDYDNYNSSGGLQVTNSEILDNLNNVEPIFLNQFGIKFAIRYQHEWQTSNDPYTISLVCSGNDRLNQFKNYWNTTSNWFYNNLARDLAILYSGIDFDGSTVGCANVGSIGLLFEEHISKQYMIVQTNAYVAGVPFNWASLDFASLTGHEMGHTMGADHVSSPSNIMEPSITALASSTNWVSQSINQINAVLGDSDTENRLSTRYIIIPFTTPSFGGIFNGGEVYIRSSVSGNSITPFRFEGVDHCSVQGTSTISSTNIGGVTIRTAPCNNSGN